MLIDLSLDFFLNQEETDRNACFNNLYINCHLRNCEDYIMFS